MTDFDLFNHALQKYEKTTKKNTIKNIDKGSTLSCVHSELVTEKGATICTDCGEEINRKITHNKEWRYYGQGDTRHMSDPNRVQMRKTEERSIFKDVEGLGFSEKVVSKANHIYSEVTDGKIFRGNSRKSIVFACIYHAFKMYGKPQAHGKLMQIFRLNRRTGLQGMKYVSLNAPKKSNIRTTYITPMDLMEDIMKRFSATENHKKEVKNLYEKIKNKSSRLNRSRPQSVASGLVYYWICLKKKDISLKEFTQKVDLSELTVNRIAKEISEVLGTPDII